MNNLHTEWAQGYFVDQPQYRKWPEEEKRRADADERLRVRPYPTENAICVCSRPEEAKWIASRLNLAARLEQLSYDFATGKDGAEEALVGFVRSALP